MLTQINIKLNQKENGSDFDDWNFNIWRKGN
jgi:hypothetical protein